MATKRGRPSKLDSAMIQRICKIVSEGHFLQTAARAVGITPQTLSAWKAKGRGQKRGLYFELNEALRAADAKAEIALLSKITNSKSWQAAAWILQRKFPRRWCVKPEPPPAPAAQGGEKTINWGLMLDSEKHEMMELCSRIDDRLRSEKQAAKTNGHTKSRLPA